MDFYSWISDHYIELFGALAGIIYVILEIRQNIWLWPVGIVTSGVYIWVFFTGKLYADMSLQGYYLIISVLGWYWWAKGSGLTRSKATQFRDSGRGRLSVSRIKLKIGIILTSVFVVLFTLMWVILDRLTDSPVPAWDSFITALSVIATWMLARKIYEHWYLWIIVNIAASLLFFTRELYPTVILYIVYCGMSFVGLIEWKKSLKGQS